MRGQVVSLPQSHSTMEYSMHGGGGGWVGREKERAGLDLGRVGICSGHLGRCANVDM